MRNVAAKQSPREIQARFPDDLGAQPCGLCGIPVVWCKGNGHGVKTRPIAVELAPAGAGDVAIERELLLGQAIGSLFAYETNLPTRYRWHGPHCGIGSHTGSARARKVRQ